MTAEQGKPLAEAKGEVGLRRQLHRVVRRRGASRVYGETIPTTDNNKRFLVIKQPIGVCAAITPWNFPIAMITRKVGAGAGRRLPGDHQAGRADAAVGAGRGRAGAARRHAGRRAERPHRRCRQLDRDRQGAVRQRRRAPPVVHRLAPRSAASWRAQCAPTIKKLSARARRQRALHRLRRRRPRLAPSKARWSASTATPARPASAPTACTCRTASTTPSSRSWPPRPRAIKVGNGFEAGVNQGPLIDDAGHRQGRGTCRRRAGQGREAGGRRHAHRRALLHAHRAGRRHRRHAVRARGDLRPGGAGVPLQDRGRSRSQLANDTEFGLASYFYSRDIGRIFRVGEALEYGMVGINTGLISTAEVPFGGVKQSGLGREGCAPRHRRLRRDQVPLPGRHPEVRPRAGPITARCPALRRWRRCRGRVRHASQKPRGPPPPCRWPGRWRGAAVRRPACRARDTGSRRR